MPGLNHWCCKIWPWTKKKKFQMFSGSSFWFFFPMKSKTIQHLLIAQWSTATGHANNLSQFSLSRVMQWPFQTHSSKSFDHKLQESFCWIKSGVHRLVCVWQVHQPASCPRRAEFLQISASNCLSIYVSLTMIWCFVNANGGGRNHWQHH